MWVVNMSFRQSKAQGKPGYIYIVECEGLYKIGITKNVKKRISGMTTGNPFEIQVIKARIVQACRENEKMMHNKFRCKNKSGEWFDLSDNDLELASKMIDKMKSGKIKKSVRTMLKKDVKAYKEFAIRRMFRPKIDDFDFYI
jgi:predicted GIY-YIG superfamily endonuclease